jgi:hypothetical protein
MQYGCQKNLRANYPAKEGQSGFTKVVGGRVKLCTGALDARRFHKQVHPYNYLENKTLNERINTYLGLLMDLEQLS